MFAPLDPSVNELYAFHGTFVRYALSIAENEARFESTSRVHEFPSKKVLHATHILTDFSKDFNIDLAGSSTGTLYGRGAYLGESITKVGNWWV